MKLSVCTYNLRNEKANDGINCFPFRKEKILERNFDTKHYWFPLPDSEVYLYEAFSQNPGW